MGHHRDGRSAGTVVTQPPQLHSQVSGALPAGFRILGEAARDQMLHRRRDPRLFDRERRRLPADDGGHHARRARAAERSRAGQHLVQDAAQRPDVAAVVGCVALEQLGRDVGKRAHDHALGRHRHLGRRRRRGGAALGGHGHHGDRFSQAEIEQLDAEMAGLGGQHHVGRLQISMGDAGAMGPVERIGDLLRHHQCGRDGQWTPGDPCRQRFAVDQLHHQEGGLALLPDVVERADVRVVQRGNRPGLALKARTRGGVRHHALRQDLDRHVAIETKVAGTVHLAHAAGADRGAQFVGAEPRAVGQSHRIEPHHSPAIRPPRAPCRVMP